jgi:hypothetical protein
MQEDPLPAAPSVAVGKRARAAPEPGAAAAAPSMRVGARVSGLDGDELPLSDSGGSAYVPFVPSLPASIGPVGAHPDAVVETGSLAAVAAPELTLLPALPPFVYRPPGHADHELRPAVERWEKIYGKVPGGSRDGAASGGGRGGAASGGVGRVPPRPSLLPARLSAPQLEAVLRAAQAHRRLLPRGRERLGFMLADQPGMGKGRCISASFLDLRARFRVQPRGLWVSVSRDLLQDAARDMRDVVGGDRGWLPKPAGGALPFEQVPIYDMKALPRERPWAEVNASTWRAACVNQDAVSKFTAADFGKGGIIFCTYHALISKAGIKGLVRHFDERGGLNFGTAVEEGHGGRGAGTAAAAARGGGGGGGGNGGGRGKPAESVAPSVGRGTPSKFLRLFEWLKGAGALPDDVGGDLAGSGALVVFDEAHKAKHADGKGIKGKAPLADDDDMSEADDTDGGESMEEEDEEKEEEEAVDDDEEEESGGEVAAKVPKRALEERVGGKEAARKKALPHAMGTQTGLAVILLQKALP